MTEVCKVTKLKNGYAYIELTKTEKCQGCKGCAFNEEGKITMPAIIESQCEVGDSVVVEMPASQCSYASLILFGLPLVLFLVGLAVGRIVGNEFVMILCGFLFAIAAIPFAILIENHLKTKRQYMPIITDKILSNDHVVNNNELKEKSEIDIETKD